MTPPHLHVIGVDPGETTGWALFTVPRASIYDDDDPEIWGWDTGELKGPEDQQAIDLARLCREIQSLDYNIGPAVVIEDFDVGEIVTTDADVLYSPIRVASMFRMLVALKVHTTSILTGDARVVMQGRSLAKQTMTDDRLRRSGYWVEGSDHERDAVRHAITALRRAKTNPAFREQLWGPNGTSSRR
jgi:hypothetical protein